MRVSRASQLVLLAVGIVLVIVVLVIAWPRAESAVTPSPSPTLRPTPGVTTPPASPATSPSTTAPAATATPAPTTATALQDLIGRLVVAPENRVGYDRDLFNLWIDADGDGCNTRREVLIEEAVVPPSVLAGCHLAGGSWFSVYDGVTFNDPSGVDIDHLVALAEAWDSGASGWTPERRQRYANDLDVPWTLIAVSRISNQEKSDQDPTDWLPPRAAEMCDYVADWIAVKVRWSLTVDSVELATLDSLAVGCPAELRPVLLAP